MKMTSQENIVNKIRTIVPLFDIEKYNHMLQRKYEAIKFANDSPLSLLYEDIDIRAINLQIRDKKVVISGRNKDLLIKTEEIIGISYPIKKSDLEKKESFLYLSLEIDNIDKFRIDMIKILLIRSTRNDTIFNYKTLSSPPEILSIIEDLSIPETLEEYYEQRLEFQKRDEKIKQHPLYFLYEVLKQYEWNYEYGDTYDMPDRILVLTGGIDVCKLIDTMKRCLGPMLKEIRHYTHDIGFCLKVGVSLSYLFEIDKHYHPFCRDDVFE